MRNQHMMKIGVVIILLVIVGGGAYYLGKSQAPIQAPEVVTNEQEPAEGVPAEELTQIQHPTSEAAESGEGEATALVDPAIQSQDVGAKVVGNWKSFFGTESGSQMIYVENFIHRFVLMFENALEAKIPPTASIFEPVFGEFSVKTDNGKTFVSEGNYNRYDEYVALLEKANLRKIVSLYVKVYPLLQSAYKEMGQDSYLNDRIVKVLDKVIQSSSPQGEIVLVPVYGRYEFEDAHLEGLSAVEKVLIRMGPGHATVVKEKAREIRTLIASPTRK